MAEMAELEARQKARGLLTEDAPMIKLAIDAPPEIKEDKPEPPPRPKAAFGEGDDDEMDGGPKKVKRTLVKLEYDGGMGIENVNEAAEAARRNAQLLEVRNGIPRDKRRLWSLDIEWEAMTPVRPPSLLRSWIMADGLAGDRYKDQTLCWGKDKILTR
jgi:RNA-binding protein 25